MTYEFARDAEGEWHHFVVFFRYGQDEQTIVVTAIGHRRLL